MPVLFMVTYHVMPLHWHPRIQLALFLFIYFYDLFIFLERVIEKERHRDLSSSIHWLTSPHGHNRQSQAGPKLGTRSFLQFFCVVLMTQGFPRSVARNRFRSGAAVACTGFHMGGCHHYWWTPRIFFVNTLPLPSENVCRYSILKHIFSI